MPENQKETSENILTSADKNKRRARKISGIFLIISVLVFGAVFAIKAVGNMPLGNNDEYKNFRQITNIFGDNSETPKTPEKRGSQNILIAGIGGRGHPGGELTEL